jgi:hypothetical protein
MLILNRGAEVLQVLNNYGSGKRIKMFKFSEEATKILDRLFDSFNYHCIINSRMEIIFKHSSLENRYYWSDELYRDISEDDYDSLSLDEQEEWDDKVEFTKDFVNDHSFRLNDAKDELELKCKVIEWLSRPSIKGGTIESEAFYLTGVNEFLGTNFNRKEMVEIYTYLGNECNRKKCIRFVNSNYDLRELKWTDPE